jgi:hypothetical protein
LIELEDLGTDRGQNWKILGLTEEGIGGSGGILRDLVILLHQKYESIFQLVGSLY